MKLRSALLLMALSSLLSIFARGEPIKVGDPAPAVSATTDAGTPLALADVYGKQTYTLVYFYPKADTPGCTKQGCSLRDGYAALTEKGVAVIGVSHDTAADQKAFKDKYHLPFTLLADTDGTIAKAFGVPTYPNGMTHRQAYLIKDGKIVYTDYNGTTDKQADTILQVVGEKKN